jgi:large subunit ribosomal protein L6
MSRIGKTAGSGALRRRPVTIEGQTVKVKGPKGELQSLLLDLVEVSQDDGAVKVTPRQDTIRPAPPGACRAP